MQVVAVAQFITAVATAGNGLGQHMNVLSEHQKSSTLKVKYLHQNTNTAKQIIAS